ncbi:MAG: choice-of-anchor tandem repeat NxxGxxAF-containing protein [Planctomycetota bacterium]
MIRISAAVVVSFAGAAAAQVPNYVGFQLQVATGDIAFNLPAGSSINSATVALNNRGDVAVKALVPGTNGAEFAIWAGNRGSGQVIASDPVAFLSDPDLNNNGRVVWEQDGPTAGVYSGQVGAVGGSFLTNQPFGATAFTSVEVNDAGDVSFRGRFGFNGTAFLRVNPGTGTTDIYAREQGLDPNSPYSFLFTPSFNNNGQIGGKVQLAGTSSDELRIFEPDGSSTLIVNTGTFGQIDNGNDLNDSGQVAFVGEVAGARGVFIGDGSSIVTVAQEGDLDITDIEFFSPSINNDGVVAFRGRDSRGETAIYVGDGVDLVKLVTIGDTLPGTFGDVVAGRPDGQTAFGGGVSINDLGEVAFSVQVNDGFGNLLGTGIYVAQVPAPAGAVVLAAGGMLAARRRR